MYQLSKLVIIIGLNILPLFAKYNVALVPLNVTNIDSANVEMLFEKITSEINKVNCFQILERKEMAAILNEQGFQLSGCTENSCIVRVGQLLSVDYIIAGKIGKIDNCYNLHLRLIEIKSSKIVKTAEKIGTTNILEFYSQQIPSIAKDLCFDSEISIEKGIYLFENGLFDGAFQEFSKLIDKNENDTLAYYWRSRANLFRGEGYKTNDILVDKIHKNDSLKTLSLNVLTTEYFNFNEKEKDEIQLNCDKLSEEVKNIRYEIHYEFINSISQDIKIWQNNKEFVKHLGLKWYVDWLNNYKLPESLKEELIDKCKQNDLHALMLLIIDATIYKNYDEGIKYSLQALAVDPHNSIALEALIIGYYNLKCYTKAINYGKKYFDIAFKDSFPKYTKYEFPLKLRISNPKAICEILTNCFYSNKDSINIKPFLKNFFQTFKVNMYGGFFGSEIAEDSIPTIFRVNFLKLLVGYVESPEYLYELIAKCYYSLNNLPFAIKYYSLLSLFDQRAYLNRAEIYFKIGKFQDAINDYSLMIARKPFPDIYHLYFERANCYLKTGDKEKAFRDFANQICINQDGWRAEEARKILNENHFLYSCE